MSIPKSERGKSSGQTDSSRRSFIWKVGAGMSAVLAATVPAIAKPIISNDKKLKSSVDSLSKQVAVLEDEKSIRELQKSFEDLLDKGMYSDVPDMFTADAEVIFNGGLFRGKNSGVRRLFCDCFMSGMTGKKIDPAPGFEVNPKQQDTIEITNDQRSAKAGFNYSIQVGAPIESDSLLVKMARLQGEGIKKWWEGGVYEVSYLKEVKTGGWKMNRLEYRTLSRADFRPGRSYAKSVSVPRFSKVFPHDPAGPDRLV